MVSHIHEAAGSWEQGRGKVNHMGRHVVEAWEIHMGGEGGER